MSDKMLDSVGIIVLILVPLYLSNSLPVILGGGGRLDFGIKLRDGFDLLGRGKTVRGTLVALLAGFGGIYIVYLLTPWIAVEFPVSYGVYGVLIVLGGIFGDLAASFAKRRAKIEAGKPVLLLDQLDFIVGGILFGGILYFPGLFEIAVIVVLTLILHRFMNFIAFKMHWKKVPW